MTLIWPAASPTRRVASQTLLAATLMWRLPPLYGLAAFLGSARFVEARERSAEGGAAGGAAAAAPADRTLEAAHIMLGAMEKVARNKDRSWAPRVPY